MFFLFLCSITQAFPPSTPYDKKQDVIDWLAARDQNEPIKIILVGEFKDGGYSSFMSWMNANHSDVDLVINMGDYLATDTEANWDAWETSASDLLTNYRHISVRGDQEGAGTNFASFYGMDDDLYIDIPMGDSVVRLIIVSDNGNGSTITKLTDDTTDSLTNLLSSCASNNYNCIYVRYDQFCCAQEVNSWESTPSNCPGCKFYVNNSDGWNYAKNTLAPGNVKVVFSADNAGHCFVPTNNVFYSKANLTDPPIDSATVLTVYRDFMVLKEVEYLTNTNEFYKAIAAPNRRVNSN